MTFVDCCAHPFNGRVIGNIERQQCRPHAVFSSDSYVSPLADRFAATAVSVDPNRAAVPISATEIREEPAAHLDKVAPPVRQWIESNWLAS